MINWNRPLRTRGNCPAVVMGKLPEPHDGQPMVVRVFSTRWEVWTYTTTGIFNPASRWADDELRSMDLENADELAVAEVEP